jgi:hypothetical protein
MEEIIKKWKCDREGEFLFKLDFVKAYDSVDHRFFDHMMEGIGFKEK